MSIKRIAHIGIAVKDFAKPRVLYEEVLGLEFMGEEEVPEQKVRVMIFRLADLRIELLRPTSEDSPISKFLNKRGEGIHHIAYDVEDISALLERVKENGIRLIDERPRSGAGGYQTAFLHPKSTHGVLTEFCSKGC